MANRVIAVAGKGGTGKTTVSALLIRAAMRSGVKPILAVDADPNYCLGDALELEVGETLGQLREGFGKLGGELPPGMSKANYLEMQASRAVVESGSIDLLTMGRQEGAGCYCFANDILREILDQLQGGHPVVVIDNEAGLEHLSRRTARHVDQMIVVSDAASKGLRAGKRVLELIDELKLDVRDKHLVINRVPDSGLDERLRADVEALGLKNPPVLIPVDSGVQERDLAQTSLLDLEDGPACREIDELFSRLVS